jgi:hypothetical protein
MRHERAFQEKIQQRIYLRANWHQYGKRCLYCERPISLKEATADHVIPRSKGGGTLRRNIAPACFECNQAKGRMDPIIFRAVVLYPKPVDRMDIHLAHFRLVLNRRLELMEKRLAEFRRR